LEALKQSQRPAAEDPECFPTSGTDDRSQVSCAATISLLTNSRKQSSDALRKLLKDTVIDDDELSFELTAALETARQAAVNH
jgi:hypothetical protein